VSYSENIRKFFVKKNRGKAINKWKFFFKLCITSLNNSSMCSTVVVES
jgi:hypothetical protein